MKLSKLSLLFVVLVSVSCKHQSTLSPEDIGKKTFNILKGFDKTTLENYQKNVILYKEMKDAAEDPNAQLGERLRTEFKNLTESHYSEVTLKDYYSIKSDGQLFQIDWNAIKFVDFKSHQDMGNTDGKVILGETAFKNRDGKIYFIKSASFYQGDGYKLMKLSEIRPVDEKKLK